MFVVCSKNGIAIGVSSFHRGFFSCRQTTGSVDSSGRVTLGHSGTLLNNDRHRLDGSVFASRQFHPKGPLTTGGGLDYTHKPTGKM